MTLSSMNISRISADGSVPPAKARTAPGKDAPRSAGGDVFKPAQIEKILNLIHAEPDTRADAVEQARALIADPNYPSREVIAKVAGKILR